MSSRMDDFTEEQRDAIYNGEFCPYCLETEIKYVGRNSDGRNMKRVFECLLCREQWEGY